MLVKMLAKFSDKYKLFIIVISFVCYTILKSKVVSIVLLLPVVVNLSEVANSLKMWIFDGIAPIHSILICSM